MAITKADLINLISEEAGITRVKAETVVNTVFDSMVEALMADHRIEIRGFGSFVNRYYEAYQGRNPRTGEVINVEEKKLPFFKVGKDLREDINSAERTGKYKGVGSAENGQEAEDDADHDE